MPGLEAGRAAASLAVLAILSTLAVPLPGGVALSAPPSGRPLVVVAPPVRAAMTRTGGVRPARPMRVGLVLASAHPRALRAYALGAGTPGSPLYHRFLSAKGLARRFGPAPDVVAHDAASLRRLGFTHLVRRGFILSASAPAALLAKALGTGLERVRVQGHGLIAPVGPVRVPAAVRDVIWVTGLVLALPARRPVPRSGPVRTFAVAARAAAPTLPATATLAGGYTVASAATGPDSVPTGLPATLRVTVAEPEGNPATAARMGDFALETGPVGSGPARVSVEGPDTSGNMAVTFTAYVPGTYQLTAVVWPAPGQPAQTITLPAVTFTGADAVPGPLDAARMNAALGASGVAGASAKNPPSVAVFATTAPDAADLSQFAQANSLTPLDVHTVAVDGGVSAGASDDGELSLDLECLDAAAPGAVAYVYETPQTDASGDPFLDVMNAVADADSVSVLTFSYAEPELPGSAATAFTQAVAALNAEGITVVAASGDSGAYGGGAAAPNAVLAPADVPAVTTVGGVDLRVDSQETGLATSYWGGELFAALDHPYLTKVLSAPGNAGNVLGGGGYSAVFPAPAWQSALIAAAPGGGAGGRGMPDIAFPASPDYPGLAVVLQGVPTVGGGTSQAAPLFAGYLADIAAQAGSGFGDLNPDLYQAAASDPGLMTQAAFGYDGRWSVSPGAWNPLTGLGTPNIGRLAADLGSLGPPGAGTLSADPATPVTIAPGEPLHVVFTATAADGSPLAGVPLNLSVTGSLPVSGLGAAAAVTGSTGQATVAFAATAGGVSGTVVATGPGGLRAATAAIRVSVPPPASLTFLSPPASGRAGQPARLRLLATTAAGAPVTRRVPVVLVVRGPRRRTLRATLDPGGSIALRLVKVGRYRLAARLADASSPPATAALRIVPGRAVRFALRRPRAARPRAAFRCRLTAYDAYGNVDTAVLGTVRFVWGVGGRTYRASASFRKGVAVASFVAPAHASGPVRTRYTVHVRAGT